MSDKKWGSLLLSPINIYRRKNRRTTYIKKKDTEFAKRLAQKEYCQKAKQLLQIQLNTLKQFDENYDETALEQIYENLPDERKQLSLSE